MNNILLNHNCVKYFQAYSNTQDINCASHLVFLLGIQILKK